MSAATGFVTSPVTVDQVIEVITAAGLDARDFKCEIVARRSTWDEPGRRFNLWEEIAEFPVRYDRQVIARAWALAGMDDPYLDPDTEEE